MVSNFSPESILVQDAHVIACRLGVVCMLWLNDRVKKRTDVEYSTGPVGLADGMCAYASEINQIWCCNPGEQ